MICKPRYNKSIIHNVVCYYLVYLAALGLSSTCAQLLPGILVPGPGMEPISSALQGGFLITGPPGKSLYLMLMAQNICIEPTSLSQLSDQILIQYWIFPRAVEPKPILVSFFYVWVFKSPLSKPLTELFTNPLWQYRTSILCANTCINT